MAWRVWMLSGMVTGAVPEGTTGAAEHEPPVVDGCTVTVIGLPVPARAHHELEVAGARTRLSGDGLHLQLEHLEIAVRLVGPRYHGELSLHPRACTGGSTATCSSSARGGSHCLTNCCALRPCLMARRIA